MGSAASREPKDLDLLCNPSKLESQSQDEFNKLRFKRLSSRVKIQNKKLQNLKESLEEFFGKSNDLGVKIYRVSSGIGHVAGSEEFQTTSKVSLGVTSQLIHSLMELRMQSNKESSSTIIQRLENYDADCKNLRKDIKLANQACERKARREHYASRFSSKQLDPKYQDLLNLADEELRKSIIESSQYGLYAHRKILDFERAKLSDIKDIISLFLKNEIEFHGKALELYSKAFRTICNIDEEVDLKIIKHGLRLKCPKQKRPCSKHRKSRSIYSPKSSGSLPGSNEGKAIYSLKSSDDANIAKIKSHRNFHNLKDSSSEKAFNDKKVRNKKSNFTLPSNHIPSDSLEGAYKSKSSVPPKPDRKTSLDYKLKSFNNRRSNVDSRTKLSSKELDVEDVLSSMKKSRGEFIC